MQGQHSFKRNCLGTLQGLKRICIGLCGIALAHESYVLYAVASSFFSSTRKEMPRGGQCRFRDGPLWRAIRDGGVATQLTSWVGSPAVLRC